jgi:hypothetical protein
MIYTNINSFDIVEFDMIIKLGTAIIQQLHLAIPNMVAKRQFQDIIIQIANDNKPMQVIFKMKEYLNDKEYERILEFSNNAYLKEFEK